MKPPLIPCNEGFEAICNGFYAFHRQNCALAGREWDHYAYSIHDLAEWLVNYFAFDDSVDATGLQQFVLFWKKYGQGCLLADFVDGSDVPSEAYVLLDDNGDSREPFDVE